MKSACCKRAWWVLCAGSLSVSVSAAEITVSAAASLTDAFKAIAVQYEAQYPDSKVHFNFAGSGALLQQIDKGAPVDVFASADEKTMDMAAEKNLIVPQSRRSFAENTLVVIAPADSKLRVTDMKQLIASPAVTRIALSHPDSVPVGRYSKAVLEQAKLWQTIQPKLITTQHVRQSLDYVSRGETDAGFVYGTDAAVVKDKVKILFRQPLQQRITYPVAVIRSSDKQAEAARFIEYLDSEPARVILQQYGFTQP
ncbi:MAG: molybdate ABC transporter substrate-binding protein [Neisseria sp.]|nr:molybdate ABC transporter substrate-binding protein [Neisseria sp.]